MKKIVLALMVCFMFSSAGFCAPHKPKPEAAKIAPAPVVAHHLNPAPPPSPHRMEPRRHHRHHHSRYYGYNAYYPYGGTSVTVRTNGLSFSYGIGNGAGLSTFW